MNQPRILFIDDEENILNSLRRLLHNENYLIHTTTSCEEALNLVKAEHFSVVVSDQKMPGMLGTELLEKIRSLVPDCIRVILTGYADIQSAIEAINKGAVYRFISKPWNDDELKLVLRQAVMQYLMIQENHELSDLIQKQNMELKELNQNLEKKVEERTRAVLLLNQRLENSLLKSVRMLSELTEMHSSMMGHHAKRVAVLSREVAKRMNFTPRDIFAVEMGATLHDIGKIGVSEIILSKSRDKMTSEERKIYMSHPIKGDTLARLMTDDERIPLMVRHHHEYWDASGFPDKLAGKNIPVGAMIISVADYFDLLMNSKNAFQQSTPENTLKIISAKRGIWFDPEVVDVFIKMVQDVRNKNESDMELEVLFKDLIPGMTISRDLVTSKGILLLSRNTEINLINLQKIKQYQEMDPILNGIFIFRKRNS